MPPTLLLCGPHPRRRHHTHPSQRPFTGWCLGCAPQPTRPVGAPRASAHGPGVNSAPGARPACGYRHAAWQGTHPRHGLHTSTPAMGSLDEADLEALCQSTGILSQGSQAGPWTVSLWGPGQIPLGQVGVSTPKGVSCHHVRAAPSLENLSPISHQKPQGSLACPPGQLCGGLTSQHSSLPCASSIRAAARGTAPTQVPNPHFGLHFQGPPKAVMSCSMSYWTGKQSDKDFPQPGFRQAPQSPLCGEASTLS